MFLFFLKTDKSLLLAAATVKPLSLKRQLLLQQEWLLLAPFHRAAVMADRGCGSSERKKKKLSKADKIFEKLKDCSAHYMKKKKRHVICNLTKKHTAANIERNRKERAAYARRQQKREQRLRNSGSQSRQGASSVFIESKHED